MLRYYSSNHETLETELFYKVSIILDARKKSLKNIFFYLEYTNKDYWQIYCECLGFNIFICEYEIFALKKNKFS